MPDTSTNPCNICGCSQTNLIDGHYYCIECGTQNTDMQETVVEKTVRELAPGELAFGKKTKIREEKIEIEMSEEWKLWHAFNFIVANMADELIALGASMTFKIKLLWVWTKYIRKFHQKNVIGQINTRKNRVIENEASGDSDSDTEEVANDEKMDYEKGNDAIKRFSMHLVYALMAVSLNLDQSEIQLSDIMRWMREGRLSFGSAIKYVPRELDVWRVPEWLHFIKRSSKVTLKSIWNVHTKAAALFLVLDLGTPLIPNLTALLNRYCKELCLPKDVRSVGLSLLDRFVHSSNKLFMVSVLPNFELVTMSCVVISLKMCFGLDDDYDLKLSFYVDEINDEHRHLKAYRIGAREQTDRLFNIRDWLCYLEFRKQILAKYYYPISYLHQIGLKEPLGSEAVKDHTTLRRSAFVPWKMQKTIENIQLQLMKNLPLNKEFNVISKNEFPASLTPLTAYTVFLVERIKDAEERLLLTEDFSKYSVKYACQDFCLRSSEIEDNLIKGVSDDKKKVTYLEEPAYSNTYKDVTGIYVIDYEYDEWAKDYKDAEIEVEETPIIVENSDDKKVKANKIEELDETENIFACFDTKIDINSLQSTIDSFNNSNFNVNNLDASNTIDEMGEYGNTFNENHDATAFEPFDPLYFNREELIRKLVCDACETYKLPIPYEYRVVKPVQRTHKKTDEAKVKRTRQYQITTTDILKTYKALMEDDESVVVNKELENPEIDDAPDIDIATQDTEVIDKTNIDNNITDEIIKEKDNIDENLNITDDVNIDKDPLSAECIKDLAEETADKPQDIDETNLDKTIGDIDIGIDAKEFIENVANAMKSNKKRLWGDIKPEDLKIYKAKKAKLEETREFFEPLIKDGNIDTFKYFIKHYEKNESEVRFEETLLNDLPNSYRVVLQNCASIIEYHIHALYTKMQLIENYLFYEALELERQKGWKSWKQRDEVIRVKDNDDFPFEIPITDSIIGDVEESAPINGDMISIKDEFDATKDEPGLVEIRIEDESFIADSGETYTPSGSIKSL